MSDITFDMADNSMVVHQRKAEPWRVTLVDTGEHNLTGGRLKRVAQYIENEEASCFTYGDGVSNVDIRASVDFHRRHGNMATVTAVRPPGRYGALERAGDQVTSFIEKPRGDGGMINGGFFVLSPRCLDFIDGPFGFPNNTELWPDVRFGSKADKPSRAKIHLMSAKCQKQTFRHSLDHLVSESEQRRRKFQFDRLRRLEVDYK
jgi:glucose-1-phosphate cytidylyltransferase